MLGEGDIRNVRLIILLLLKMWTNKHGKSVTEFFPERQTSYNMFFFYKNKTRKVATHWHTKLNSHYFF